MSKTGVSLRIEKKTISQIDELAQLTKRDRSFIINEAIESYLEMHRWQLDHIQQAVKQADEGIFVSDAEVKKAFKKWKS